TLQSILTGAQYGERIADALRRAFVEANRRIHEESVLYPELANMGSTLVCTVVAGDRATVGHVGYRRSYLLRQWRLERWTTGHTVVEELVASGALAEEQARDHYQANVLTRALGPKETVEPDIRESLRLTPGDALLLCSDGLSGYLSDAEIELAIGGMSA